MDYTKEEINMQDRLRLLIDSLLISHYGEDRAEQITIDFLANQGRSHQLGVLTIALNGPEEILHWSRKHLAGVTTAYHPGCCMYGIITNMYVQHWALRGGIGQLMLEWAELMLKNMNYGTAIATIIRQMEPMKLLLLKNGYTEIHTHGNNNSGNYVNMLFKDLLEFDEEDYYEENRIMSNDD